LREPVHGKEFGNEFTTGFYIAGSFNPDMTWQKRLFIFIVLVMAAGMAIASWDIARRTTFPGSKGQLKERIRRQLSGPDTIKSSSSQDSETPQKEPK